jgi:hypothetical protein
VLGCCESSPSDIREDDPSEDVIQVVEREILNRGVGFEFGNWLKECVDGEVRTG